MTGLGDLATTMLETRRADHSAMRAHAARDPDLAGLPLVALGHSLGALVLLEVRQSGRVIRPVRS